MECDHILVAALFLVAAWVVVQAPWQSALVSSAYLAWTHYAWVKQSARLVKLAAAWGWQSVYQKVRSKYVLFTAPPTGNDLPGSKPASGVVMRRPRCSGAGAALVLG